MLRSEQDTVQAVRAIQKLGDPKAKPPANLADQVAMAMTLLGSDLGIEIAFVTLGGFDNHAAENTQHPKLLTQLDDAIDRFTTDVAAKGRPGRLPADDVLRVRPAGRGGRQLGHRPRHRRPAVRGRRRRGRRALRRAPEPEPTLDKNKNLIRTVDFREVYSTVLDGWLGRVPASEILGTKPADGLHPVGFLR